MSLLNAWITRTEAIVAVDTDGVDLDGKRMPTSKLLTIPHLNAVLGLRGQAAFLSFVFLRCLSSSFESFDEMNDALPLILEEADSLPDWSIAKDCRIGNEMLAVGWSDRRSRMLGRQFVKRDGMTEFSATDADFHVSPWHSSMSHIQPTAAAVERIAREQVRWMRETYPGAACGGKLIVCNINKGSISMSHRFTFPAEEKAAA